MGAALSSILWRSPVEVAKAERALKRASVNRNTRATGAALLEVKRARTEALRRELGRDKK